jgi:putative salt-induced outer membrane protein
MRALFLAVPLLLANTGDPATIPPEIRTMLDAAMASGSEGDVSTIVKYAKGAAPGSADAIMKLASDWRDGRRKADEKRLREADFLDLMKGRAEFGGYVTTGNTKNVGVTAAIELKREGIEWRHKLKLQGDYQESLGITTRERYLASYEPNWKFDDRAYLYGAALYESDRFSGFSDRYSLSVGTGYSAIRRPRMKLELELGPAFRYTRFVNDGTESNLAARGSVDFDWKVTQGISVRQNAAAYVQDANSTVSSKSALLARLIGPLSAQLSYTLQYESEPRPGRAGTDTTSRAALVVDF